MNIEKYFSLLAVSDEEEKINNLMELKLKLERCLFESEKAEISRADLEVIKERLTVHIDNEKTEAASLGTALWVLGTLIEEDDEPFLRKLLSDTALANKHAMFQILVALNKIGMLQSVSSLDATEDEENLNLAKIYLNTDFG